eukprot:Gb_07830 [translate_table: standard]
MLSQAAKSFGRVVGGGGEAWSRGSGAIISRSYHERVVDHYNNPRNIGSFDKDDANVGTGLVGAPACGDVMKLQIKVDEESGQISDACFKTFGCGSAIASSSLASEWIKGKQLEEAASIKNRAAYSLESVIRFKLNRVPELYRVNESDLIVFQVFTSDTCACTLFGKSFSSMFIAYLYLHHFPDTSTIDDSLEECLQFLQASLAPFCDIAKHLFLPPVKLHCSMLAEDAIKAAVKDFEAKRAKRDRNPESPQEEKVAGTVLHFMRLWDVSLNCPQHSHDFSMDVKGCCLTLPAHQSHQSDGQMGNSSLWLPPYVLMVSCNC